MTRMRKFQFRRLIIVAAMGAGALGLAVGTSGAASAATTGGNPYPTESPSPTVLYTPPPSHHRHHKPPAEHCFVSLETEHDTLNGQPVDQKPEFTASYTDAYWGGQPQGDHQQPTIEVVQLVKVCVTEGEHGQPDTVQAWDLTGPFAFEVPASGMEPTPSGLPSDIKGMLPAA